MPVGAVGQTGLDIAQGIVGTGIGMALGKYNDKRQLKQAKKLQALEIEGSKQLTDYSYGKQLQMWKDTNYSAQMEQLEQAGLNPGLLYGMGGAGGQSTGGGAEGVTGQQASQGGGGEIGMGIQFAMMGAQTDLLKAQARKANAEADKTVGVDTEETKKRIEKLSADITTEKAKQGMMEIQTNILQVEEDIKGATQNAAKALVFTELRAATERLEILTNEKEISNATKDEKIQMIGTELAGMYLRNELTRQQGKKTKQEIDQMSKELQLKIDALANEQDKTKIQQQLADFETSFGKQVSSVLQTLLGLGKGK